MCIRDRFGTDESTSAQWAYVYGVKGRYDERESEQEADREHLNEASRGLYFDELKAEMVRISKGRKEGEPELYIPSDKFNRGIGKYSSEMYTVKGEDLRGVRRNIKPTSPKSCHLMKMSVRSWRSTWLPA